MNLHDYNSLKWYSIFFLVITIILFLCLWVGADEIDDLVPYIIMLESSGNPNAVSKAGCIGLMQINPKGALAEWNEYISVEVSYWRGSTPFYSCHNVGDLFNPSINVKIGTWYLKRLKNHYIPKDKYSIELLLACYNAGPTRMRKLNWDWKKAPQETINYIRKYKELANETNF